MGSKGHRRGRPWPFPHLHSREAAPGTQSSARHGTPWHGTASAEAPGTFGAGKAPKQDHFQE